MKSRILSLLIFFTAAILLQAQTVTFKHDQLKGWQQSNNYTWAQFSGLTYGPSTSDWYQWGDVTSTGNSVTLGTTEKEVLRRKNLGAWAGDCFDWFHLELTAPSYSRVSYTLDARLYATHMLKTYEVRVAIFDYANDSNGYWAGRNKDPKGNTKFHTADYGGKGEKKHREDGEQAGLYYYNDYKAGSYTLHGLNIGVENSTGSSQKTAKWYGGLSSSKTWNGKEGKDYGAGTQLFFCVTNIEYTYFKYVSFNANGGSGSMSSVALGNGNALPARGSSITPVRGFTFKNWNTQANGSGTTYADKATISVSESTRGAMTLYAQWSDPVCQIGSTKYGTVQAAINAATSGQTVKLITNCTEYISIVNGKNVTLDLNGYVLTGTGTGRVVTVAKGGTFKMTDSNPNAQHKYVVQSTGVWRRNDNASGGTDFSALTSKPATNSVIIVKGGAITGSSGGSNSGGVENSGTFTVNGGNIIGNYNQGSYDGGGVRNVATMTINGGRIVGNSTTCDGGGVYNGESLTVGGTAVIAYNTKSDGTTLRNLYVMAGKDISISSNPALTSGAKICVSTQGVPTTSSQVVFSKVCNESAKSYFQADNNIYTVIFNSSNKLELGGYLLTIDAKGGTGTVKNVRTIKGQPCPTLPNLTKEGYFIPGWYTVDQSAESSPLPQDSYKVESGQTINFAAEKTAYAWWKPIVSESTDAAGHTEVINKPQVSTKDIAYVLEHSGSGNTVAAVDMSSSKGVDNPTEVIDLIHNSTRTTPNTLIFFPNGVNVPQDRAQNVVIKQVSGKDTTYKCVDFSVTDGMPVSVAHPFNADAATYNRRQSSRWGTVCVPYELKSDERVQFYTSGTIKGDLLVLEKSAVVPAGHGAIYQVYDIDAEGEQGETLGKKDFAKTDLVKVVENTQIAPTAAVKVHGQFTELKVDDAKAASEFSGYDLYYYKDNKFYKRTSGQTVTIPALRAYILISKSGPSNAPQTKSLSIIGK